ncbi:Txe/YoeB family addiction module toxin [Streptomyces sp. NPDC002553]|uniref:Txe/YoeB family addiction module toxin n=1 Tax=Streptomyces sp. NPDC002553 TaxID=3154417 RepID=UPI00332B8714
MHLDPAGWEDILFWLGSDRAMARRTTRLIAEIQCTSFTGVGKPEPMKRGLSGYWSRRTDDEEVVIVKARYQH